MKPAPSQVFRPSSSVRIAYVILFTVASLVWLITLWAAMVHDSGGPLDEESLCLMLLITGPLWLLIFVRAYLRIARKDYIQQIAFHEDSGHILLTCNRGLVQKWPLRDLAFSVSSSDFHHKLVFYRRVRASEGRLLNKKVNSLLVFVLPLGWTLSDLNALETYLRSIDAPSIALEEAKLMDDLVE